MTEQQLNNWRQQDKNLRDAVQQDAMEQPQMPADLNARLMQRVAAEKKQPRRIIWPWVAAACVAGMLMIWLTPPKDEALEVAQTPATKVQQEAPLIAQQAPKEAPEVAQTPTLSTEVQQPAPVAKKAPNLEIKAGVVEGTFYDAEGMKAIASVPSREVLLSKLLGSIQSPITNLARVLNQIAENGGAADAAEAAPAEEATAEAEA